MVNMSDQEPPRDAPPTSGRIGPGLVLGGGGGSAGLPSEYTRAKVEKWFKAGADISPLSPRLVVTSDQGRARLLGLWRWNRNSPLLHAAKAASGPPSMPWRPAGQDEIWEEAQKAAMRERGRLLRSGIAKPRTDRSAWLLTITNAAIVGLLVVVMFGAIALFAPAAYRSISNLRGGNDGANPAATTPATTGGFNAPAADAPASTG